MAKLAVKQDLPPRRSGTVAPGVPQSLQDEWLATSEAPEFSSIDDVHKLPRSSQADTVLRLQRTIGNAAVLRMYNVSRIQRDEEDENRSQEPNASYDPSQSAPVYGPPAPNASYDPNQPNASVDPRAAQSAQSNQAAVNNAWGSDEDSVFDESMFPAALGLAAQDLQALRELYNNGALAIRQEAQLMLEHGAPPEQVANWANAARNELKATVRDEGPRIVKRIAEARNIAKYGNPLGPSADSLREAGRTNEEIIEGAGRTSAKVSRWAGRLRIAGRIMIVIDIGIATYNVATAPEVDRPRVLMREMGGLAGAWAGAVLGAEGGAMAGGAIGAAVAGVPTAGVGALPGGGIGATIGGIVGGIGGALLGAWGGHELGDFVADQMYPPAQTRFEGDFQ